MGTADEESDVEQLLTSREDTRAMIRKSSVASRKAWTASVAVAATGLLVGAAVLKAASVASSASSRTAARSAVQLQESSGHCHTAVKGEKCYVDVDWAMTIGITGHPEWYTEPCPNLRLGSNFQEFQTCVMKINQSSCVLPCNPAGTDVSKEIEQTKPQPKPAPKPGVDPCHIARRGEKCFAKVVQTMLNIKEQSTEITGLSVSSTFEEVQASLHQTGEACPRPCSPCRTSTEGERCYRHVLRAKEDGIKQHPGDYPGLTQKSPFEEFQALLHKDGSANCSSPCNSIDLDKLLPADLTEGETEEEKDDKAVDHEEVQTNETRAEVEKRMEKDEKREQDDAHKDPQSMKATPAPPVEETCNTASQGTKCYQDVLYGMQTGVHAHPEWYHGLTDQSSFEEFQAILAKNPNLDCREPCPCHTAIEGEVCHQHVAWVVNSGLATHPSWYPGLSAGSRFEDIQARVHEDANTTCQKPCTPPLWGTPSLFCFSIFRSQGYELDLVKAQVERKVGIFSCDEFATLSDIVLPVSGGVRTLQIPPCETVGVSKDGTAANTLIFMQAWNVIKNDGRYAKHDWTIKADPDAVLIVPRLRQKLLPHTGKNIFMKNCMKWTGIGWPMMFGSLEAYTKQAMETYYAGADKCKTDLQWQAWGEDLYMGICLNMLGAGSEFDGNIIGDNVCKGANCADGVTASYHPFKSAESWFQCHDQAVR